MRSPQPVRPAGGAINQVAASWGKLGDRVQVLLLRRTLCVRPAAMPVSVQRWRWRYRDSGLGQLRRDPASSSTWIIELLGCVTRYEQPGA